MRKKDYSLRTACRYFEKSRQGYYDRTHRASQEDQVTRDILSRVKTIRAKVPGCGTRKLQHLLHQEGILIGRDRLFGILREARLFIRKKPRYRTTTDSGHGLPRYENVIKDLQVSHAEEVFVSDITYINTEEGCGYLSIVADSYSKKIMGYDVSRSLQKSLVLHALVGAIRNRAYNWSLVHHSDQGSQYCSRVYINALKLSDMTISMSGKGKAWENAVAERIMGILKHEYGLDRTFKTFEEACRAIEAAIESYNKFRPHLSCGYLTPEQAHAKGTGLRVVWKSKKISVDIQKERKEAKERKKINSKTVKLF